MTASTATELVDMTAYTFEEFIKHLKGKSLVIDIFLLLCASRAEPQSLTGA